MLERFIEAERCCRLVIESKHCRVNTFIYLGLSLEGQGRFREAIDAYITSIKMFATNKNPLILLEIIIDKHPELKEEYNESLKECKAMVKNEFQSLNNLKQLH